MPESHNPDHEKTMLKALDHTRVLEGENLDSTFAEDAVHWAGVYAELIAFKQRLLGEMRQNLPTLAPEAAAEVKAVDMEITGQQMNRYKERRAFWLQRVGDLSGERQEASR